MQNILDQLNASCQGEVKFIQVGANEGVLANDPLCPYILNHPWKGVLIEPVPRIFKKLQENYSMRPHLHFEMVAISDEKKTCDFFVIDEASPFFKQYPRLTDSAGQLWGDQLGSFHQEHILDDRKFDRRFSELSLLSTQEIKALKVECVPLNDIIERYEIEELDLLQIDAEGHDDTILAAFDFNRIKPKVIIFEHMHMTFDRYCLCMINLRLHGYAPISISGVDTVVGQCGWNQKA